MITKVLIANRGEIACRVIESVQAAGYDAVAVYSDADSEALFVGMADESVALGGNTAAESYLDIDKIIQATKASGANAIHPGYGFLSENADFSARCEAENIIFIGPGADAIRVMGNKAEAKRLMQSSSVPCIPGYEGEAQDTDTLIAEANKIGFPIMVKAAAGGGGRGIRLVSSEAELSTAIDSAKTEAQNSFGSAELILEKAVVDARHIEIQVAADIHGNAVHIFERDCSAQRRHQKVIEEAPSPFMTEVLRDAMGQAAVNAARAVDYRGVGTVEFLVDAERNFYFLEMNTRLQVEHPVTEMITGLDLVDWQLRIARNEVLPLEQDELEFDGHAIEVRIYAEDPARGFMPQTGELRVFEPAVEEGVRIDHGVYSGTVVSPYYDSMLAKLITWGSDREEARRRLLRALRQTTILGLTTNKPFLSTLLSEPDFIDGEATTGFINDDLLARISQPFGAELIALAGVILQQSHEYLGGFSNSAPLLRFETLAINDQSYRLALQQTENGYDVTINEETISFTNIDCDGEDIEYTLNGVNRSAAYDIHEDHISIDFGHTVLNALRTTYQPAMAEGGAGSGIIKATTEGLVVNVLVQPGDQVKEGDTLVIIEAMKMEHRHTADGDGEVTSINVEKNQQVKNRQLLVELALTEKA
ncbi:MAG: acetyl-CoA carboxylase biotin carboxylase subunit [Pseudomonadota bacterium]